MPLIRPTARRYPFAAALIMASAIVLTRSSECGEKLEKILPPVKSDSELTIQPSAKILSAEFVTSSKPWRIPATESISAKKWSAPAGAVWDFRRVSALSLKIERVQSGGIGSSARLRWLVTSRVGGLFIGPAVPLPINGSVLLTSNFLDSAGELSPAGHQRPWDALAAAEVIAIELRVESAANAVKSGALDLHLSSLQIETAVKPSAKPRLLDLALEPPPPGSRARYTLTFRIDPPPADPYAASGEGDVRVKFNGTRALAFLDQDVESLDDGSALRVSASGLPYWRAFMPEWDSAGTLEITSGANVWKINSRALALRLDDEKKAEPAKLDEGPKSPAARMSSPPRPQSKTLARPRWETPLETQPPGAKQEKMWTGVSARWSLKSGAWEASFAEPTEAKKIWRPVPFWDSNWGGYANARRPDAALAHLMDSTLEDAARSGESRPLAILDGGALERQGVFNWSSHPLRSKLAGPGQMFSTPEGIDFCSRWMRYCIARYGHSKAVSELWITSDLNAPGASDFHAKLAPRLQEWQAHPSFNTPLYSFHPLAQPPKIVKDIGSFERAKTGFYARWRADQRLGGAMGRELDREGLGGSRCFEIRALETRTTSVAATVLYNLETSDYRRPADDNFFGCGALMFDVWTPADAPHDLRIGVHLRDRDGEWFQALLPGMVRPGDWSSYALDLTSENAHGLVAVNPKRMWTDYSRQRITEIGLHIYSTHPNWKVRGMAQTLNARFDNIRGVTFDTKPQAPLTTLALFDPLSGKMPELSKKSFERGAMVEYHFRASKAFANPFDPRDCDLTALVKAPSGKITRVPLFFNQRCDRREQTPGGTEIVETQGDEFFTLRYRAQEIGPHSVAIELREGGKYDVSRTWEADFRYTPEGDAVAGTSRNWPHTQYPQNHPEGRRPIDKVTFVPGEVSATLDLGKESFSVVESAKPYRGFVRPASDQRHFQFDDGTFFYPIGPCLRSPSDNRVPYNSTKFNLAYLDKLSKRGTYQYDDYFESFGKSGINWARVWMCSWWGALEWRRDWPGYQGLGRYNLLNAWRMDYIVALAEKKGLYLNLALTNHGQFTLNIDTEWENNPYNSRLGGPINAPMEIFTRGEAKIAHQNKLRYVAARYGHSPNVMAFALFSELEFTEEYDRSVQGMRDNGGLDLPAPHMESWHAEMAGFLKSIDPNRHMIATHFSHPTRGEGTLMIPEIDIATSNAYSAFEELGGVVRRRPHYCDASEALNYFWNGNSDPRFKLKGFKIFNKPALVEEQGRHWMGMDGGRETNTKLELDADLHAGLWGSMVLPLSGATGYWWWLHVHFDDRYGDYQALAKFMEGEDFRPQKDEPPLEPVTWKINDDLYGRAMKSNRRVYAWIYHPQMPQGAGPVPDVKDAVMKGGGLKPGKYRVEFWDTYKGVKLESRDVEVLNDPKAPFSIKLPTVQKDLAVKIKPI